MINTDSVIVICSHLLYVRFEEVNEVFVEQQNYSWLLSNLHLSCFLAI